jgi:hypothetical protein
VQYRDIHSSDVAEFRDMDKQVVLTPPRYKTGEVIYPYADAKK